MGFIMVLFACLRGEKIILHEQQHRQAPSSGRPRQAWEKGWDCCWLHAVLGARDIHIIYREQFRCVTFNWNQLIVHRMSVDLYTVHTHTETFLATYLFNKLRYSSLPNVRWKKPDRYRNNPINKDKSPCNTRVQESLRSSAISLIT